VDPISALPARGKWIVNVAPSPSVDAT